MLLAMLKMVLCLLIGVVGLDPFHVNDWINVLPASYEPRVAEILPAPPASLTAPVEKRMESFRDFHLCPTVFSSSSPAKSPGANFSSYNLSPNNHYPGGCNNCVILKRYVVLPLASYLHPA